MLLLSTKKENRACNFGRVNKGFTLVEMIVVMLILTVLAAILIPSLMGFIDEAKGKQHVLNARSIYMSAQAIESEKYAAWDGTIANAHHNLSEADKTRIVRMADLEGVEIVDVVFESDSITEGGASSNHGYFTIVGITVKFDSVTVTLKDGVWTVLQ
ncbi:MAG: type II secretion system protein [Lachnospiraceae bacterium]|nr:type II secretion system protein [Lachnospiraceae bacterium]